ncbi:MAG: C40 family peptidase [Ignavibacteriae bacterium]|nr:glycoside hydrolase [Ignavibacteriota bacterium]NOG99895.1 C40 family peptidase [Ignavibacteriota bacterium]
MKKIAAITLILMFSLQINAQENVILENLNTLISKLKSEYAPDKRVALWDVEVKKEGDDYVLVGETNLPRAFDKLTSKIKKNKKVMNKVELLPAKSLGEENYGIVNLSVANMRSKPGHPAELATQTLLGTVLKIYKKRAGFYYVQTPDMYLAWMDDDGLFRVNKSQVDEWLNAEKVIYIKDYGFSYNKPDKNSQRVSDLALGNLLKLKQTHEDFVEVSYPDGRIAFVEKEFVMDYSEWLKITKPGKKKILERAHSFMGIPYLWGGTSTKGMDCSGFTKTVYYMSGVVLPRDASQQVHTGELVDTKNGFDNLQPGDLLFFGTKKTKEKKERITHVGIYIGDGDFIHASGMVKVNSLDKSKPNFSQYRFDNFIRAKRILTSINKNGITTLKTNNFYNGDNL